MSFELSNEPGIVKAFGIFFLGDTKIVQGHSVVGKDLAETGDYVI